MTMDDGRKFHAQGSKALRDQAAATTLDRNSLVDQVENFLFKQLVAGRLQQGERINEAELARILGISRNPIREAVRKLEERGLLISIPHKGNFVRHFELDDVNDIFTFRICIESAAIRATLPRMRESDFDDLAHIVDAMIAAAEASDERGLVENDIAFHHRICALSGSRHIARAFNDIYAEVRMLITLVEHRFESLNAAAIDHWPVVEALRTRDPEKAIAAMVVHLNDPWGRIVKAYEKKSPAKQA